MWKHGNIYKLCFYYIFIILEIKITAILDSQVIHAVNFQNLDS